LDGRLISSFVRQSLGISKIELVASRYIEISCSYEHLIIWIFHRNEDESEGESEGESEDESEDESEGKSKGESEGEQYRDILLVRTSHHLDIL
jgi:hypothetical protein